MTLSKFTRICPRCETSFAAVTESGICPTCSLFSRIGRDGTPCGIATTIDTTELPDWPYGDISPLAAAVLGTFADGGYPLFYADRNDGYPSLSIVHEQLLEAYAKVLAAIRPHLPSTLCVAMNAIHKLPTCYASSVRIEHATWYDDTHHYDLICYLDRDGGSVDAILDHDAFWHSEDG